MVGRSGFPHFWLIDPRPNTADAVRLPHLGSWRCLRVGIVHATKVWRFLNSLTPEKVRFRDLGEDVSIPE